MRYKDIEWLREQLLKKCSGARKAKIIALGGSELVVDVAAVTQTAGDTGEERRAEADLRDWARKHDFRGRWRDVFKVEPIHEPKEKAKGEGAVSRLLTQDLYEPPARWPRQLPLKRWGPKWNMDILKRAGDGGVKLGRARILARCGASKVSPGAKVLFTSLVLDFLNRETGQCYPTREQLAEKCGISVRTVARKLNELKDAKLLDWIPGHSHGRANGYRFLWRKPSRKGGSR